MQKKELKIFLASDHAGFDLKNKIKTYLEKNEILCEDFSPKKIPNDDYPDQIFPLAKKVARTKNSLGIIFGGSGQGEAIVANKVKGIRAAVIYNYNSKIIKFSKEHNDANILSIGTRFFTEKDAIKSVNLWLKTSFSNAPRHKRRIRKI